MLKPIRFLMIGGFLGAGKTTAIARLASHFVAQGKNVALVTNDQAYDLVDTHTLRAGGFNVGEVPGACFCCKFDDLVGTIGDLSEDSVPEIVIAEPVGSCTDLVATVIEPMQELFGDRFELGPLVVLLKPEHGRKILGSKSGRGFSPKAEYIFLKQLEEADAIAINKVDKLSSEQQQELLGNLTERFPDSPAFGISARNGDGFEQLIEAASGIRKSRAKAMPMDYETYAEGEAELGWLNGQIMASSEQKFSLDEVTLAIVIEMSKRLADHDSEVAHLKVLGQTLNDSSVANIVGGDSKAELSLASEIKTQNAELLVNARVAADPQLLESIVHASAESVQQRLSVLLKVGNIQRFRPAPPQPTHGRS
jgi:G3E family GTPase